MTFNVNATYVVQLDKLTYALGMDEDGAGARIRAARIARGMTQAELAACIGVSRSAVAQWETDRAGQVRGNLARIADVLGVSTDHLVGGKPGSDLSPADATELALLRLYRACDAGDRQLLLRTAIRLARAKGIGGPDEPQSA